MSSRLINPLAAFFCAMIGGSTLILVVAASADQRGALRSAIALKVFPRVVAVDLNVDSKLAGDGYLELALVFDSDRDAAESLRRRMSAEVPRIRDWQVRVSTLTAGELGLLNGPPAAVFVVEPLAPADFEKVLEFCVERNRMVFSPFAGDVERGAMAGLDIGLRVSPYFNVKSLLDASISIDPQVLRISKLRE